MSNSSGAPANHSPGTPADLLALLRTRGHLPSDVPAELTPLTGGVSNGVWLVSPADRPAFVLKQSRTQLATPDPWFSRLDRIFREIEVMRLLSPMLPAGVVPRVLFEDREHYLFGMEAIDLDHIVWKRALLQGIVDPAVADRLGVYLGTIHRDARAVPNLADAWGDLEVFDQLRIDPFYRRLIIEHPELASPIGRLIDDMLSHRSTLVLADFSPKNILITRSGVSLVDFETAHFGDPAFDVGFFLSHLQLKTVVHARRFDEYAALSRRFWERYRHEVAADRELEARSLRHLAACMWARVDATSKVDYLQTAEQKQLVRDYCRGLLFEPAETLERALERLQRATHAL
ncbi:MAG TPA: aminoglycoside phosphotransferase family protein [Planctomycetaceae bacterium]|nr:aminoglycoside phosphotransferase family protein [Planctomycetaceae bacterium]